MRDDADNRICKLKRKEWSLSKSQVIVEKEPELELTSKMVKRCTATNDRDRITKARAGSLSVCFVFSRACCWKLH